MPSLLTLVSQEYLIQTKSLHIVKFLFLFLLFNIISIVLIHDAKQIKFFAASIIIITIPLSMLSLSNNLIKNDINDGYLEMLLTQFSSHEIVFAKFLVLFTSGIIAFCGVTPIIYVIFTMSWHELYILTMLAVQIICIVSSLIMLLACIQSYFVTNTNFLSLLIMPFIIPCLILAGIILGQQSLGGIYAILFGINLIITPISLFFSSILIANIYHI